MAVNINANPGKITELAAIIKDSYYGSARRSVDVSANPTEVDRRSETQRVLISKDIRGNDYG